ncbi:MAG TPA: toll/interleukin-1 receptor domain-containing protein [Streptosporangiaceae bacterium]
MTVSGSGDPGRIFISYRREDAAYPAGWLFDRLADHFGQDRVFKDVDSIELGDDFVEVITAAVASCAVLLAVIGPRWLSIADEDGQRRLDGPEDFVRLEIEAALERNVRVIPVLVQGARMPPSSQLPDGLRKFARRQALELTPARFGADCGRLIKVLDKTLTATPTAPATISPGSQPDDDAGHDDPQPTEAQREQFDRINRGILQALYAGSVQLDGKSSEELAALVRQAREQASEIARKLADPP